jgi:hypothetical protein
MNLIVTTAITLNERNRRFSFLCWDDDYNNINNDCCPIIERKRWERKKNDRKKYKTIGKKKIYWSIDDMQSQYYYAHSYKDKRWEKNYLTRK